MTDAPSATKRARETLPPITPSGPWPWAALAVALVISLGHTFIGWNLPLLDLWRFRETQVAISIQSILEDGFHLDYATPVLGAPWSIPFEFPTYQFCVAALVKLTGWPIDQTGRAVSLAFAYGAFALIGWIVARLTRSTAAALFTVSLALLSPVFIYGSRAVMIESTALCLTLAMVAGVLAFLQQPRARTLVWIFLAGLLAGPTKATTYAVGLVAVAGLILVYGRTWWPALRQQASARRLAAGLLAGLALPFAATLIWTAHTDAVKQRNEQAHFLTSSALHNWNFGTWQQRLDPKTWETLLGILTRDVLGSPWAWLVLLALLELSRRHQPRRLVLLAAACTGGLVFTNLYAVHGYYHYATGLYLLAVVGCQLGDLWDDRSRARRWLALGGFLPVFATLMLWGYHNLGFRTQTTVSFSLLELAQATERLTPAGSAILVYGQDWESSMPYYAHRRALMNQPALPVTEPLIQRALARLDRPLSAVVFSYPYKDDFVFVHAQLTALGFGHGAAFSNQHGDVYLKSDHTSEETTLWRTTGSDEAPAKVDAAFPFQLVYYRDHYAVLVHAPGSFTLSQHRGSSSVRFGFGIRDEAFSGPNHTDGVTFVVDYLDAAGHPTRLFERRLDPFSVAADRGLQTVKLDLPARDGGQIVFRTEPGPTNGFDWSLLQEIHQE